MKILQIIPLAFIFLFSCKNQKVDALYHAVTASYFNENPDIVIPICYQEDSLYIVNTSVNLYNELNMKICSLKEFQEKLYRLIINHEYLEVSESYFKVLEQRKIQRINRIDSVYQKTGIKGVIRKFTSENGALFSLDSEVYKEDCPLSDCKDMNYVIYLCFQHNLFFWWDCECLGLYIQDDWEHVLDNKEIN